MNKYAYKMPYVPLRESTDGNMVLFKEREPYPAALQNKEKTERCKLEKRIERAERICAAGVMLCMERNGLTYEVLSKDIDEIIKNV